MNKSYRMLSEAFENLNDGAWISRVELAKFIGRAGYLLQKADRDALLKMIDEGYIEARLNREQWRGVGGWQYRKAQK